MLKKSIGNALCVAATLALGLWSGGSLAATYSQSDLTGTWRFYSFRDGDVNNPGWTRSIVTIDAAGNASGQDIDSDGSPPSTLSGSITISGAGALTLSGPLAADIVGSDFQMDTGKTVVSGVVNQLEGSDAFRNFVLGTGLFVYQHREKQGHLLISADERQSKCQGRPVGAAV